MDIVRRSRGSLDITTIQSATHDGSLANLKRILQNLTLREMLFVVVITLVEFGCNIALDTPGALQNSLIKNYHLSASKFSLFYSLYFVPTIAMNAFSGYLIDRVLGIKLSTLINCIAALIGCALFALGGVYNMFWMMLVGRLIFGLGNEMATGVCVNYCMFSWYRNSVVNLMSSLYANGGFVGTLVIYQTGPRLVSYFSKTMPEKNSLDLTIILASSTFVITAAFAVWMTFLKPNDARNTSDEGLTEVRIVKLKDIFEFPAVFWFLCTINVIKSMVDSFNQFSQGLLTSPLFGLSINEASNAVTTMNVVNIVLSIPISFLVDVTGRNTRYILVAQAVAVVAFLMFIFGVNPYAGMTLLGAATTVYTSAILPMYAYPLENHLIGSCYGIMSTAGGLSMTAAPLGVGHLIDAYGYQASLYFYLTASSTCLLCMILVYILDKRGTGILSMTPKQRIEYELMMENIRRQKLSKPSITDHPTFSQDKIEPSSSDFSSMTTLANNMIS